MMTILVNTHVNPPADDHGFAQQALQFAKQLKLTETLKSYGQISSQNNVTDTLLQIAEETLQLNRAYTSPETLIAADELIRNAQSAKETASMTCSQILEQPDSSLSSHVGQVQAALWSLIDPA